jgi:hypothetical protein
MKQLRVRWAVHPTKGVFGWVVTRKEVEIRRFLFKYKAVAFAVDQCNFDLTEYDIHSELLICGRDGKIKDARTYGDDPRGIKG